MSIHTNRSKRIARERGGMAGNPAVADLWDLSKRELVELTLRLTMREDAQEAADAVRDELTALRVNGIV